MRFRGKSEYKKLNRELAVSTGDDFQRKTMPLLRCIFGDVVETPRLKRFDRTGLDIVSSEVCNPIKYGIQCKGFEVTEDNLGDSQIRQCENSINIFLKSDITVNEYYLIHNRDSRSESFRNSLNSSLDKIVSSGKASKAILLDRHRLIDLAFVKMEENVIDVLRNENISPFTMEFEDDIEPLQHIPLKSSRLILTPTRMHSQTKPVVKVASAYNVLIQNVNVGFSILLGEFGFGKTTTLRNLVTKVKNYGFFFVQGASIDNHIIGSKDFFLRCVNVDTVLNTYEENEKRSAELLIRPAIESILTNPESKFLLLIDGIDESSFLTKNGGLQHLFNILHDVKVPTIVSMRTEYWNSKQTELSISFSIEGKTSKRRKARVNLTELIPWENNEILLLLKEYLNNLVLRKKKGTENLKELMVSVKSGSFNNVYGDIPRRPLFLRMIIDNCITNGIAHKNISRATLFREWIIIKIQRDKNIPIRSGGFGRVSICNDNYSLDDEIYVIWTTMSYASQKMTTIENDEVILQPSCKIDFILHFIKIELMVPDPNTLSLSLNSLLIPILKKSASDPQKVRFAHRAFQEFFLAWHIVENEEKFKDYKIPEAVAIWIKDIRSNKLIDNE